MSDMEAAGLRRLSRRLAMAATVIFGIIVALMLLAAALLAARLDVLGARRILLAALLGAPIIFHLWALWSLRGLFASLAAHGLVFGRGAGTAVERTGWGLLLGGGATLAATPPSWR